MAAVLAQRMRKAGHLGAAYFCRQNDGTRNDPRYLLGTVACQICESNSQYNTIVGGEGRVRNLLGNSKLGVPELFTKLLQEPLGKCNPNQQRKLVIVDALDETEYESRDDFLDLIMHRFPLLPEWLVFFITSRPEDSVQFRLKKYNPCVKICAGNGDQHTFYQQHEQDIKTFLTKRINFSPLPYSVEDMSKKCHGLFLYAHYIVEELRLSVHSGKKLNRLSDLIPGDIDDFFLQNFTRVCDQVGQDLFKKLFGCAVVAPSPLPVSVISYILKRENSDRNEQQVIDAVSQFVVLRTSDQTLTFLHNLIPAWLTSKNRASRKLLIDKQIAVEYLGKFFVEILTIVVNEPQPIAASPSIDVDLEEYVSRVAIRFLCQFGETDSLKTVFSCLTSYHFMERRVLSGRIEIYRLVEDFKLASGRFPLEQVKKQQILEELLYTIENNVHVLLKCPHLLQSCIRNASKPLRETVSIPQESVPLLEWNIYAFPDAEIADMHCFATSSDKKTLAGAKGRSLLFFDASTAETVSGPFKVSIDAIRKINQLEYSPDGKFIFFGRLDKWFSVERGRVEDFPQFSGNSHVYRWGVFTRDGKSIVVKRDFLSNPATCEAKSCLFNLLALWALKEIEESQDDEMTVSFCPQVLCRESGVEIKILLKRHGMGKNLDQTRKPRVSYDPSCHYCCRLKEFTESSQKSSLATIRQLVIELYPDIFNYQIWNLQSGMPVLQQVFSHGVQLNSFTYLCHVTCAFNECGLKMDCSGIVKVVSVCNIAAVTAVYCALFGRFYFGCVLLQERVRELLQERLRELLWVQELKQELKRGSKESWELERMLDYFPWPWGRLQREREEKHVRKMERVRELKRELVQELEYLPELDRMQKQELVWELEQVRKLGEELERLQEVEWELALELEQSWKLMQVWQQEPEPERKCALMRELKLETERKWKWEHLVSAGLFKEVHDELFKFGVYTNIPKAFQDLVYDVNGDILWYVSPERNWIIEADGFPKICILQTGNREHQFCNYGKPEHTISKVRRFSFTNDDLYFVYSSESSLHALSLQTGAVLTSVSGFNLYYFTKERQVGYLFCSGTEEKAIFLTNLFSPFRFLSVSPVKPSVVGKSCAAMFCSSDTIIYVGPDSMGLYTLRQTSADKEGIAFIRKSLLTASSSQVIHVKNCVLSPNGKLIAIRQENDVKLYSFAESGVEFFDSVFESKCDFTITHFAFSADSTVLLFCIQDTRNNTLFYLWDIQKKVVSASFESPGFLEAECCCFSLNKRELIMCGEYQIEVWNYAEHNCRCLTRLAVEKPYNSVKFSHCTLSLDNQFLVCCIADVILVYSLHSSDIHSSMQVLRGHLGRVELCQFLKINRYLISFGVDGMVFLWDLNESKAVGFARVTQDQDSIVTMAVSPEEDRAVCFTSSGRVCVIKLCELGSAMPLKTSTAPVKDEVEQPREQIPSASQSLPSSVEDDMAEALSSSDSEGDFLDYYLEQDLLDESD